MSTPDDVLTVSALNRLARQTLEKAFPLSWIAGEVSNLTRAPSGHIYFTLKDEAAQARCVMFRSRAQSIPWRLENGQQIEARALVSLYEARGDFQLNVEAMRRAGLGRLFEAFARLKEKLLAAGLFALERKRALPRFPSTIGVVSSPNAAALHDVLVAIKRRAPHLPVILYPTPVQGIGAGDKIADALALAIAHGQCQVLLLVRGGGSIEDLWAFNEEVVAHTIAASPIPVISGVGHETDTTIADFVADMRAATPTAAAELATQGWFDAADELAALQTALTNTMQHLLATRQQQLDQLTLRLIHPANRVRQTHDRLAMLRWRLNAALKANLHGHKENLNRCANRLARAIPRLENRHHRLAAVEQRLRVAMRSQQQQRLHELDSLAAALGHLNPQATMERGFAIIRDEHGKIIADAAMLHPGQSLQLNLARGSATASVESVDSEQPAS